VQEGTELAEGVTPASLGHGQHTPHGVAAVTWLGSCSPPCSRLGGGHASITCEMATAGWQLLVRQSCQGGCAGSCPGVQHHPSAFQELTQQGAPTLSPALQLGSSRGGAGRDVRPQARTRAALLLWAGGGGPAGAQPRAGAHPAARQPKPLAGQHSPTPPLDPHTKPVPRGWCRAAAGSLHRQGVWGGRWGWGAAAGRDEHPLPARLLRPRHCTHSPSPDPAGPQRPPASPRHTGSGEGKERFLFHHRNWLHRNNMYILMISETHWK